MIVVDINLVTTKRNATFLDLYYLQVESDSNRDTLRKKLEDKSRELRYSANTFSPN